VSSSFILWLFFSPIAALMAFLITYGEFSHHYADRGRVFREALQMAVFALVVFLLLGLVASFILPRTLK